MTREEKTKLVDKITELTLLIGLLILIIGFTFLFSNLL